MELKTAIEDLGQIRQVLAEAWGAMSQQQAHRSAQSEEEPADLEPEPTKEALAASRKQMLEKYKQATGNPSNKSIYEAKNSMIYKPEFYKWRKGELPQNSSTTVNFERFLNSAHPPD